MMHDEINLSKNANKTVLHRDSTIIRQADHCSGEIHRFLRYLTAQGLPVEQPISIADGKEYYAFAEAERVHPNQWSDAALYEVGKLTKRLHLAGAAYRPENPEACRAWYLREIGKGQKIWCHGDLAPWNMLTKNGASHLLVDWEYSGPLDPLVELARVCWLFVQLHDDDLASLYNLPSPEQRAGQVRLLCDGYGLEKSGRLKLTEQIIEVIICETAHEAIGMNLSFASQGNLWGFAWRTRSLYWVWRNRAVLENALV